MERIFLPLSIISVFLVALTGAAVYWANDSSIKEANRDAAMALASGTALGVAKQVEQLSRAIGKMAGDPLVIEVLENRDRARIRAVEAQLEKYLPGALKIRLLRPEVNDLDTEHVPHMGFADLDMVKETIDGNPLPAIQGEGANRHLAITARMEKDGYVGGVILASLSYDFIKQSIQSASRSDQFIQLKQSDFELISFGDRQLSDHAPSVQIPVANTAWTIHVWYRMGGISTDFELIAGIILTAVLLACLAFYVAFRKSGNILSHDQSIVLKAVKDLMTGNPYGNYPVNLTEMSVIISTLVQFKRVLDHQGDDVVLNNESDADFDGFFEESDFVIEEVVENAKTEVVETEPVAINEVDWDMPLPEAAPAPAQAKVSPKKSERTALHEDTGQIFRDYDIRGIVGQSLTNELACDIGRAFGTEARNAECKVVIVGRDGRQSSPELADAVINGIVSTGRDVLDLGMVPTPILYFVTQHTEGRTGLMVTGSHNPAEYNGMKMVIDGETLAGPRVARLKNIIDKQDYAVEVGGTVDQNSMFENEYIGIIAEDVHLVRSIKVVLDCGNGVAGEIAPLLFKTLGCEVVELFCDVDGSFPNHHPDPSIPENLEDLIAAVQHYEADVGIAFDGDGDRLGVVDSNGKIIWPDRLMMLFAKDVLARKPGAQIVYDVKCSRHLADQISKYGGRPLMWKTGHSHMKAKVKETGAKLAGEMSGHVFFNDRWYGFDDALYSAARLIEILSSDVRTSAEIFAAFPESINTPELLVSMKEGENVRFIERLFAKADFKDGKITNIDGLRVDFSDGWGLVRASNTTPSLVVRFEADNEQTMGRIQEEFRALMTSIEPQLVLPF